MSNSTNMIRITGLWLNENEKGEKYFAGSIGQNARVLIFRNHFKKEGSKEPDYNLFIAPIEQKKKTEPLPEPPENESPF